MLETEYLIRLRLPGGDRPHYAAPRFQWTDDRTRAIGFPTATRATIIAIEALQLSPDAFELERRDHSV